jgi:alpha-glucosidase
MVGDYKPLHSDNQMIAYYRRMEGQPTFLIILNLSHRPCYFPESKGPVHGVIEIATSPELEGTEVSDEINLGGDQGVVIRLSSSI